MKTMRLDGGLMQYAFSQEDLNKRYKSDISPKGRKVRFLNDNGYDIQREYAKKLFGDETIFTVDEIYVGRSSSEVSLKEFPNKTFNTVMFADVEE